MNSGFRQVRLGDIASITIGRTPPRNDPSYWTSDLTRPFCTIADMQGGSLVNPQREGVTAAAETEGKAKRVPAGSLLLSFKLTIGRVGVAAHDLFPNEAIACIEPLTADVDKHFLALALEAQDLAQHAGRAVKGKTLNGASLQAIQLSLPSIAAQLRIVDLLTACDTLLTTLSAQERAADQLLTALRERLLRELPTLPLGEICSIQAPLVDPRLPQFRTLAHLGIDSIEAATGRLLTYASAESDAVISAKFHFLPDEVVLSKIRPNLRKAAWPRFEALCSADAYPLRPTAGISAAYLLEVLLSEEFTDAAVARSGRTKMPKINREDLFTIRVPVTYGEAQSSITNLLNSARNVRDSAAALHRKLRTVRAGLLADLLSGAHQIPSGYDVLLGAA